MPLLDKLRDFLDANRAEFTHTVHSTAYTAREVASAEHLPAREVAKTVVVASDDKYFMLVIPGNKLLDFHEVRMSLGLSHVRLATEFELAGLFADCELGAMPPFGSLYGMPVYLEYCLADQEHIAFNAGTHRDEIHMRTAEYRRLAHPAVAPLVQVEATHSTW